MGWDGIGIICCGMGWDGTEKYVPWTSLHIFEHLNKLNTSMQGKRENVLTSVDKICAIRDNITIRIRKVKESNFESFSKTAECVLKNDISLL